MEQTIGWKRAAFGSLLIHLVIAFSMAFLGIRLSQEQSEIVYDVDITFSQGKQTGTTGEVSSGKPASGAMGEKHINSDLSQKESSSSQITTTEPAARENVAIADTKAVEHSAMGSSVGGFGEGVANEAGGAGLGSGDGTAYGDGSAQSGEGTEGAGDGSAGGGGSFDTDGFWAQVNNNKSYPPMAIKRGLEGDVTVAVSLDGEGNYLSSEIISSSASIFNKAALQAVRAATPYPNGSGQPITVTIPIHFRLH